MYECFSSMKMYRPKGRLFIISSIFVIKKYIYNYCIFYDDILMVIFSMMIIMMVIFVAGTISIKLFLIH